MDWRLTLADLRAHLPQSGEAGPDARQARGSLRWLEAEMRRRGANPVSVRNIIYRDIGTAHDKAALRAILSELAAEAGRPAPQAEAASSPAPLPDELELLGRSKKRAYKQFLAGVRAGRSPRLIVTGRAGAGKTVLLDHVERALQEQGVEVRRLALSGEVGKGLALPAEMGSSFAELAQAQADAAWRSMPQGGVLLARVTDDLQFHGGPPRDLAGQPSSAARWATLHLLERAPKGVSVLLALEKVIPAEVAGHEVIALNPPTPAEARTYLMTRLGVPRAQADRLVAETGRHLDRLTLLVRLTHGEQAGQELLNDPQTRELIEVTAALHAASLHDPEAPWSDELLTTALGHAPRHLPAHARALLGGASTEGWWPTQALRLAWPNVPPAAQRGTFRRLAEADDLSLRPHRLAALACLHDWAALSTHITHAPDDARHLPALWPLIRSQAGGSELETLARAVISHHAGRGEYNEPRARDALFTLLQSSRDEVRAWARVKLAESSLEAGNMGAARDQLAHPDVQNMRGHDPWTLAAQADALLVQAALARWQGDLKAADQAASDPRASLGGARALLWRGLIAKDAGRWPEALQALVAVPASSPLLSARARYQEGDLRLRLGQPVTALAALLDAAARLDAAGATREERSRVLARTATALRRLGRPAEAQNLIRDALALLPADIRPHLDGVPRARLLSESVPILLALARPDEALERAVNALHLLTRAGQRADEVHYRARRTHYRVALSYLTRGLGKAYLQPFIGPQQDQPDLAHARTLLGHLIAEAPTRSDRDQILLFDMLLSRALAEPDARHALDSVARALEMTTHAYEEAQARAMRAEALLRARQPEAALADINRAHALLRRVQTNLGGVAPAEHTPDPGLHAQLLTLEAAATIQEGATTIRWLRDALQPATLAPFRAGVWRETGLALESLHPDPAGVLSQLYPQPAVANLRPADVLRLRESSSDAPA